jgi:integrase
LGKGWENRLEAEWHGLSRVKKLDSRTARRSIVMGKKTHWLPVSPGRALGYRRGRRGGSWIARFDAEHLRREKKLGQADDVHDSDGVQILDFAEALKKANHFFHEELRNATGELPRTGPYDIAAGIRDYLESLKNNGKADYESAVYDLNRNVLPAIGGIEITKLTRPRLEAWRAAMAARPRKSTKKIKKDAKPETPRAPTEDDKRRRRSTANRTVRRLVAALNYALETGKVNANPMNWKIAPFENADAARTAFLTEPQQRSFVTACGAEPEFQNLVLAGLLTGSRFGELSRLRVQDFIPASKSIYIGKSKSGKSRHVFLDDEGVIFFSRLAANRAPDEELLLRADGTAWVKGSTKKPMRRACAKAEIAHLGFHQLRHSFSTRLLMRGVAMKIVAQLLGHTSVRMLDKNYGHLVDEHVQEVISELRSTGLNRAAETKPGEVAVLPSRKRSA